jgi:capsular polysaccharide transport system permease protein
MARIYYAPGTGLIEVEIRAFRPEDAKAIAEALFRHSSTMINELSSIARNDTTRYAKQELEVAVERLKVARQALTRFRNETRIVDPAADLQGQTGLITSLQAQLAEGLIDLDMLSASTRASDPRVENAKLRIAVIERRIEDERRKLGASSGEAFADLVGQFEVLRVDMEFAEKTYFSALSTYDGALSEAGRQSRYLAAYLEPTLAEKPQYPDRVLNMTVLALMLFGIWTIMVLIYYSLKDRR